MEVKTATCRQLEIKFVAVGFGTWRVQNSLEENFILLLRKR